MIEQIKLYFGEQIWVLSKIKKEAKPRNLKREILSNFSGL